MKYRVRKVPLDANGTREAPLLRCDAVLGFFFAEAKAGRPVMHVAASAADRRIARCGRRVGALLDCKECIASTKDALSRRRSVH